MAVAVFDLDNTLLGDDSDTLWGSYLVDIGAVDPIHYKERNEWYYQQYKDGCLDIDDYLTFALRPLAANNLSTLHAWREDFITTRIEPIILPKAEALLNQHRAQHDMLLIITATNKFITDPIAKRLGVTELLATEPELIDGKYTGRYLGTPTFQAGKITAFKQWQQDHNVENESFYFYSDSHNDLPLMKLAEYPIAVDPDEKLQQYAAEHDWKIMTLRD